MTESFYRGRRLRRTEGLRRLARETHVTPQDLIQPIFATSGRGKRVPIESMEGICRYSVDQLGSELEAIQKAGVSSVLVFGMPEASEKDAKGSGAYKSDGAAQEAIRRIKKDAPDLTVISDVCLCAYTETGHCGVTGNNDIDNDATLGILMKVAVSHAEAGADVVAPSDMMDGRVEAIRSALDESGFSHLPILSYSAKYASGFYGPFREATDCAPKMGDRKGYQMDPPNVRQAMREIEADIEEGADMVMVKPALAYLDVIRAARESFDVPLFAYNVSGEYAMVKAAAARGWINETVIVREILTAIKRAGADRILTYFAKDYGKYF
jgi:porphobilinogen synthase